jgi:hypothetical protein
MFLTYKSQEAVAYGIVNIHYCAIFAGYCWQWLAVGPPKDVLLKVMITEANG